MEVEECFLPLFLFHVLCWMQTKKKKKKQGKPGNEASFRFISGEVVYTTIVSIQTTNHVEMCIFTLTGKTIKKPATCSVQNKCHAKMGASNILVSSAGYLLATEYGICISSRKSIKLCFSSSPSETVEEVALFLT